MDTALRHAVVLGALGAWALGTWSGCTAIWPPCKADTDCPGEYVCNTEGRCATDRGTGTSSSSSTSSASSSSGNTSAGSSVTGSSSVAGSSGASASMASSGTVSGSSRASSAGTSAPASSTSTGASSGSSGAGTSSSGTGVSSSGGLCVSYEHVGPTMARPFQLGQEFRADVCSEGVDTVLYWTAPGTNVRYHSKVRLDGQRFPRSGGIPSYPLDFMVRTNTNQVALAGGDCADFYAPSGHCEMTLGFFAPDYLEDVLVTVTAKGLDAGTPYEAFGEVSVAVRDPCQWDPPNNTSEGTAAEAANPIINGRVLCQAGTTYFWRHQCAAGACHFIGTFADEAHRLTDFNVEVTSPAGPVSCPMVDGGRFACTAQAVPSGYNYVKVTAALDGGTSAIPSEYLNLQVQGVSTGSSSSSMGQSSSL